MSKRVFAIHDLAEEIYDFGDAGRDAHRQKQELVQHELGLWFYDAVKEIESSFYSSDYPCDGLNIDGYLEDRSVVEKLNYIKYFKRCRCCSRHSHYKMEAKPDDPVPESKHLDCCNCRCRHYTRIAQASIQNTPICDYVATAVWDTNIHLDSWDAWTPVPGTGWG